MKLNINNEKSVAISKDMYGLFFEDINYSLDGGLNAEMLENRNFEALFSYGVNDNYQAVYDGGYGWSVYDDKGAGSTITMDDRAPLNNVNPHYMVFVGNGSKPSFKNKAYDGIYLKAGMKYYVSFYAKHVEGSKDITVSVCKNDMVNAAEAVIVDSEDWKQYKITLISDTDVEAGDFIVSLGGAGVVCFDAFSMMPEDAVLGIFRKDLVEKLEGLKPSFIRFPGGCVVEGNTLANRYKWKDTIAPVTERRFNWNRWAVHGFTHLPNLAGPYSHYGQTLAVGFYEYFLLCEHLGAKPLPVMNVGMACQYQSSEIVNMGTAEFENYIQDTLDLIEFANGDTDTVWGAKREQMGHAQPFNLEYLGVGNEQWETDRVKFYERYTIFEGRIHEKYPDIKIIGTSGPDVWGGGYFRAWDWAREQAKSNDKFMYAMDEHYYVSPEWLYEHTHFYDEYDRDIKVFAGEYACHISGLAGKMNTPKANNLTAALAEAAFLTGIERNADVVVLASYAPLFARMGYTQWSPDLIWFDGKDSYGTPSYYVQQLFSTYRGVKTLNAGLDIPKEEEPKEKVFASAVTMEDGSIVIKLVNGSDEDREIEFCSELFDNSKTAKVIELTGDKNDTNSMGDLRVVPQTKEDVSLDKYVLKKNSFAVVIVN